MLPETSILLLRISHVWTQDLILDFVRSSRQTRQDHAQPSLRTQSRDSSNRASDQRLHSRMAYMGYGMSDYSPAGVMSRPLTEGWAPANPNPNLTLTLTLTQV